MKYQKYYDELQNIIHELESGDVEIDQLASKIKRAQKLIESCEKILSDTQANVEKMLKKDEASDEK